MGALRQAIEAELRKREITNSRGMCLEGEKNATRIPRARPLAWCLVRLLAVVGLFWARSLELELELILSRWLWERGEKGGASLPKQICTPGRDITSYLASKTQASSPI